MKSHSNLWGHAGFIAGLLLLIRYLEAISTASVYLTERLARASAVNHAAAVGLVLVGFTISWTCLRKASSHPVRQVLMSYIFAAVGMAGIYYLIYTSHAGCYSLSPNSSSNVSVLDFVYFSFVTITTLGYGDVVPNHTFVRMLVVLQILFGAYLILRATAERPPHHLNNAMTAQGGENLT